MNILKLVTHQNKVLNHSRVKREWHWEPLNVREEQEVHQSLYVGQVSKLIMSMCNHNNF